MFSPLTSKIFAGLSSVLTIALIYTIITDNIKIRMLNDTIEANGKTITRLRLENATFQVNQTTLEGAVTACSASVEVAAAKAGQAATAGVAALNEARKGSAKVARTIETLQAMPAATCADAEAILRAGARP